MYLLNRAVPVVAAVVSVGITLRSGIHESPVLAAGIAVWVALPYAHLLQQVLESEGPRGEELLQLVTSLLVSGVGIILYLTAFDLPVLERIASGLLFLLVPAIQWLVVWLAGLAGAWAFGPRHELEPGRLDTGH